MSGAACGRRGRVMSLVLAAVAGSVFGVGLLLAGMTNPARVVGFLDVTGSWDPSLAFVLGGAIAVYALALRWIRRRRADPWFDGLFHLVSRRDIDRRLVIGAAIFGVGWGLGGLCPGPAVVAAFAGNSAAVVFVATMLVGMLVGRSLKR